ncbi:uncharacterized protein L201_003644 [Kwoniella dendrophila CBS 6074]|uniref:Peroxin-19 n=1 Tax=Kwoniella dendrophila CBS 6074 TaxID=1295534 RepID=A0AAX4JU52_9TREE
MPPPEQAESSNPYRNPTVEEDSDDEDLDDLDDVLQSFNSNNKPSGASAPPHQPILSPPPTTAPSSSSNQNLQSGNVDDDDEFEASLMEGMDALLKQLAGDHPPGPMLDAPSGSNFNNSLPKSTESGGLSKEAEEEAWQKALEMVLSGEGLKAMGLDDSTLSTQTNGNSRSPLGNPPPIPSNSSAPGSSSSNSKPSYEETLAKTLESLNQAGTKPSSGSNNVQQPDLSSLLASLGGDPDLLKDLNLGGGGGGGEDEDDGDLANVLEGMMKQLMTKEVLEEPMTELASKYPPYLSSPPSGISNEDLSKYQKQNQIVQKIVTIFRKSNYSDEKDGKEISELVSQMQDLGGPPKEILGDLPEGFDLGALGSLGNEDGCTMM